jgi:5-methyltetrahydrofolate corrinoid/iron sulfur protein methyltransferase
MYIIGELINGMDQRVAAAIKEKNKDFIRALARKQLNAGADALDVNCGPASRDAAGDMRWLVETIREEASCTLSLDSTKPEAIEAGLDASSQKCMINSTSADISRLEVYCDMAKKYKASLVALVMDHKGVPQDKDGKLELAAQILSFAQESGFSLDELYLDPILLPINVAQNQLFGILELIKDFKSLSNPAPKTLLGLSNVSQGSKRRRLINRTFLVMAFAYGLDAAILDPLDDKLMYSLITSELILNKSIYCSDFISAYNKSRSA